MPYRRTITMTAYNRPDYLKKTLGALSRCRGIDRYLLILCIEPGCPEVLELARSVSFASTRIIENPTVLSCPVNIFQALSLAFLETDYNIHLEDDLLLHRDGLNFFEHCRRTYAADPTVLSVTAYNNQSCAETHYHALSRRPWFTPWAWATWADRFEELKSTWDFNYCHGNWDHNINSRVRGERREVFPILARAQNIGVTGHHVPSEAWGRVFHHNEFWAGLVRPEIGAWGEVQDWEWQPHQVPPEVLRQFPKEWLQAASIPLDSLRDDEG